MSEPMDPTQRGAESPVSSPVPQRPTRPAVPTSTAADATDDWPKLATDAVVKLVDSVREKTTGPAINGAHALKYGIVAGILISVFSVIALIGAMRLSEALLQKIGSTWDVTWLAEPMWIVYLVYGAALSLIGLWLWRKSNQPAKAQPAT